MTSKFFASSNGDFSSTDCDLGFILRPVRIFDY